MIRDFIHSDLNAIINLLQQGYIISTQEITDEFIEKNRKIYIYDDGKVKGFALIIEPNSETNFCKVRIYVEKKYRHQGIGKKLHDDAIQYATVSLKCKAISVGFTVGKDNPTTFFTNLSYEKWYISHDMVYTGGLQADHNLNFINYNDKYFEKYVTLQGNAFYDLRRANDIKPYNCSDFSQQFRDDCNMHNENIYILLDDEDEIISSIRIKNSIIDEVMVSKKYEGQGYGCKTTQFGINIAINNGAKNIKLCALDWNKRAISIYEALGFNVIQTFHNYRKIFR